MCYSVSSINLSVRGDGGEREELHLEQSRLVSKLHEIIGKIDRFDTSRNSVVIVFPLDLFVFDHCCAKLLKITCMSLILIENKTFLALL